MDVPEYDDLAAAINHASEGLTYRSRDEWPAPDFSDIDQEPSTSSTPNCRVNGTAAAPKIRSISDVGSIFTFAAQKIEYVIQDVMPEGMVTAFTGESGSGKSTVVSAMGSAIERGELFAGLATQRRPVLILDRENPLAVVVDRFTRLGIRDSENFRIWGRWCPEEPPDALCHMIVEWVISTTPKPVIFVDSLVAFHPGDENDAGQTRAHMDGYRKLSALGATIGILHHNGKGESTKDYRGSTDFKASIDVGFSIQNIGSDPTVLETARLRSFKNRIAVRQELVLRFRAGEVYSDEYSNPAQTTIQVLRDLLIANPRVTSAEFERLAMAKSVSMHRARNFLNSGISERTIDLEVGVRNARYHTWLGLPETGDC